MPKTSEVAKIWEEPERPLGTRGSNFSLVRSGSRYLPSDGLLDCPEQLFEVRWRGRGAGQIFADLNGPFELDGKRRIALTIEGKTQMVWLPKEGSFMDLLDLIGYHPTGDTRIFVGPYEFMWVFAEQITDHAPDEILWMIRIQEGDNYISEDEDQGSDWDSSEEEEDYVDDWDAPPNEEDVCRQQDGYIKEVQKGELQPECLQKDRRLCQSEFPRAIGASLRQTTPHCADEPDETGPEEKPTSGSEKLPQDGVSGSDSENPLAIGSDRTSVEWGQLPAQNDPGSRGSRSAIVGGGTSWDRASNGEIKDDTKQAETGVDSHATGSEQLSVGGTKLQGPINQEGLTYHDVTRGVGGSSREISVPILGLGLRSIDQERPPTNPELESVCGKLESLYGAGPMRESTMGKAESHHDGSSDTKKRGTASDGGSRSEGGTVTDNSSRGVNTDFTCHGGSS
jgi:hypothetical protein